MGRIVKLRPEIAAQIAAGEVISRPAAVVKELVENALDAGARAIAVALEDGGRRRLRVVDDGWGMTPEEAPLSLERHATSKLQEEADLLQIKTLGFRGEALPSIAAVSRLELITRAENHPQGTRLTVVAGELQSTSPWPAPPGTQVVVADLFFNTPARRKFLRAKETEQAYVVEVLRALALSFPEVQFELKSSNRTLLAAPGPQELPARVASLYGPELAAHLIPLALSSPPFQVAGLISRPDFSLAASRFQVFLVNRRTVQDRILGAVLRQAYQGLLPRGRHPAAVVCLTLPADQVDVNVHPTKAEVRFRDSGRVYALLLAALREALGPPPGEGPRYTMTWQPAALPLAREAQSPAAAPWAGAQATRLPPPEPVPAAPAPALSQVSWHFRDLTVLGQLAQTYILAQAPEGLVLIDQHAAHERVLYERLQSAGSPPPRQPLLFPQLLEVSPGQADWLRTSLERLSEAGLVLEPFGGASFLITAAPACLAQADLTAVALEAVEKLAPVKSSAPPQAVVEQTRLIMACRGAIKAGQSLTMEEVKALLAELDGLAVSSHCPHGRPLWRLIPFGEIRQGFRRPPG
jgi:DNA mismatch repair protein MutL